MDAPDDREASLKELPTRELKIKRHKDRRESLTIPPIRLRLKSSASSMNSETDTEKRLSDRSVSSSPEYSPVFISAYSKNLSERNSSLSPKLNEYVTESKTFPFGPSNYFDNEECCQPIDMSRKCTEQNPVSKDLSSWQIQQRRPSVIKCASTLLKNQCNLSDVSHNVCNVIANCDSNSADIDNNIDTQCLSENKANNNETENSRVGKRREIVSGSCDPVIDEHFRRSLGEDYQNIFSKSTPNTVSITVDDHFAKALGDTWHQLQQTKADVTSIQSRHSSSTIQAPSSSQFLHHSSEILS